MKRTLLTAGIIILACLCACTPALAVTSEHATTNGLVASTNTTSTAEWKPQALFVVFPAETNGLVTVTRRSRGVTVPLARHAFSNTTSVTWLPTTDYPIRPGDVFAVTSSVPTFTLQLERITFP